MSARVHGGELLQPKVLVTGAGALLGQGVIRSLRRSDLNATIIAVDPRADAAGLYWADGWHLIPEVADNDYLLELKKILAVERPQAVLIGTDVELMPFAGHREELEQEFNTKVVVSNPEVVSIADDKFLTYRFLKAYGFPHPATALPEDVEQLVAQVGFPLVVKPRTGTRSVGVRVVHTLQELTRALGSSRKGRGGDILVQEYVGTEDQEYTAGALVFDGQCEASVTMRRDLRHGNTYRAHVESFADLNQQVVQIAEALDITGPANFQFRLTNEKVTVFEINARFSGTTPLRALAGVNEVALCLRRVLAGVPIRQPAIKPMTILRHWSETVVPNDIVL